MPLTAALNHNVYCAFQYGWMHAVLLPRMLISDDLGQSMTNIWGSGSKFLEADHLKLKHEVGDCLHMKRISLVPCNFIHGRKSALTLRRRAWVRCSSCKNLLYLPFRLPAGFEFPELFDRLSTVQFQTFDYTVLTINYTTIIIWPESSTFSCDSKSVLAADRRPASSFLFKSLRLSY